MKDYPNITTEMIKKLREESGYGILECRKALIHSNGNYSLAVSYLKTLGYCSTRTFRRNEV